MRFSRRPIATAKTFRFIVGPPWVTDYKFGHNGPVVINHAAILGNNVNLSQFTTIEAIDGDAAVIGDNVYIGPACCLIENDHIGDNVTIGAGSVVTKEIPANATAVGNYAKVVNFYNPGRYVRNR